MIICKARFLGLKFLEVNNEEILDVSYLYDDGKDTCRKRQVFFVLLKNVDRRIYIH